MHNGWVKRVLSIGIVTFGFSYAVNPASATAPVYCVNCGSEITQLAGKLTMVKQLATQAQQLQAQLNQYQNMVTNSKGVSQNIWGNTMSDLQKLNTLFQQSKALAGSASNLDGQFASRYGTYSSYLNKSMGIADWRNKYSQWSQQASDNTLYTLKGIGMQNTQMQSEHSVIQQLQAMSGTAEGRMQAMQVANMFASQNLDQMMKLRQLIMMQVQMQANYMAQQQDRQAASDAAVHKFYDSQLLPTKGGKTY